MEIFKKYEEDLIKEDLQSEVVRRLYRYQQNVKQYGNYGPLKEEQEIMEILNNINEKTPRGKEFNASLEKITSHYDHERLEEINQAIKEDAMMRSLKRTDRRAGYINASAYIFVIVNVGLFLSVLLLILK